MAQLSLRLHDFILHQTGDPRYQADPLLGLRDSLQPGEVVEYFSPEMGLLRLDTGSTVLFHLNQVRIYIFIFLVATLHIMLTRSGLLEMRQKKDSC